MGFAGTYKAANVGSVRMHPSVNTEHTACDSFLAQANNHQFDFWQEGVTRTEDALNRLRDEYGIESGGVGTPADVVKPRIITRKTPNGDTIKIAVFTLVAQLCHKLCDGRDIIGMRRVS